MRRSRLAVIYAAISVTLVVLVVALSLGHPVTSPTLRAITTQTATAGGPPVDADVPPADTDTPAAEGDAPAPAPDADVSAVLDAAEPAPRDMAASPTMRAVTDAYVVGAPQVFRLALAVLDLRTNRLYAAGDVDATYASASLVKVFIAARLLVEGQADEPQLRDRMWRMIVCSDDDAATMLYDRAGGTGLMPWVSEHYGIDGLTPPTDPTYWGTTGVTARAMVEFYARVADDPAVGPWLREAMGSTQPYGCDGFYQHFGLPSAAAKWQTKQGWMCCLSDLTRMHSAGYVNDRWAVALLTEGGPWMYGESGVKTVTLVAQTLLPEGTIPANK